VKEWRELWAARAWWLLLLATGPLVGLSFISAVQIYAELSGYHGTTEGVGQAFSPLVGIWAPTFSAYELIAAFLFPFVVIRLVAGDRQSGVLKLESQQGLRPWARVAAKVLVLMGGWLVAMLPAFICVLLWTWYGGHTFAPELLTVVAGHVLNAGLTIAIGVAAASIAEHPATAAIIALAVTIGTWVVSFFAALKGGVWDTITTFTPPAMVAQFQHGLIRLDVVLAVLILMALGMLIGATWMQLGTSVAHRAGRTAVLLAGAGALIGASSLVRPSWDASENRQNSFAEADETLLRALVQPVDIEAHFAAEDARRYDLERMTLSKLRRVMPHLTVRYVAQTSVGIFEQNTEHYGEVIYTSGGRDVASRVITTEGVLENIYRVAGVTPPAENDDAVYRGYPLAVPPRHAAIVFYVGWPALVAGAAFQQRRRA
jgi:hypothetical protein